MFIEEKWTIGNIIRQLREERKATQYQLCCGLCSISTINRIETDERNMNMLLAIRIFQRLGFNPDKFELYGSNEELEQFDQRTMIEKCMRNHDLNGMRQELDRYRNKWGDFVKEEPLHQQFVLGMESYLDIQDGNIEKGIQGLEAAIKITVPDLRNSLYQGMLVGEDELALFDMLADAYDLSGDKYKAFKIREEIIDYWDRRELNVDQIVKLYTKLACKMTPVLLETGRISEGLQLCAHAIEILSSKGRLFHYPDVLYWKGKCLEELYHQGKAKRQEVVGVYQRAYYMYDLFENEEMAADVWNHLKEEYGLECIR